MSDGKFDWSNAIPPQPERKAENARGKPKRASVARTIITVASGAVLLGIAVYLGLGYFRSAPDKGQQLFDEAYASAERKDYDRAIELYSEAIKAHPEMDMAYCNRGVAYVKKKQYQLAFADLTDAVRINPNNAQAQTNLKLVQVLLIQEINMAQDTFERRVLDDMANPGIGTPRADFNKPKEPVVAKNEPLVELDAQERQRLVDKLLALPNREAHGLSDSLVKEHPELAWEIMRAPELYKGERKHWFSSIPSMTSEQRKTLMRSMTELRKSLEEIEKKYPNTIEAIDRERDDLAKHHLKKAMEFYERKNYEPAIAEFTIAIKTDSKTAPKAALHQLRSMAYVKVNAYVDALADIKLAVEIQPSDSSVRNQIAWLLATCPDDKVRNGKQAVEHATRVCELTAWEQPFFYDTLAAAYAEAGQFDKAVRWQEKALEHPDFEKKLSKVELPKARCRLELYKSGKSYREPLQGATIEVLPMLRRRFLK